MTAKIYNLKGEAVEPPAQQSALEIALLSFGQEATDLVTAAAHEPEMMMQYADAIAAWGNMLVAAANHLKLVRLLSERNDSEIH